MGQEGLPGARALARPGSPSIIPERRSGAPRSPRPCPMLNRLFRTARVLVIALSLAFSAEVARAQTIAGNGNRASQVAIQRPAPADQGVRVERWLPDFDFDPTSGAYGQAAFGSAGQPMLTWDGLLRFSYRTVTEGGSRFSGLVAEIVDYEAFERHPNGRLGWQYRSNAAHPAGFPLWKSLWYDTVNGVYSRTLTPPFSDWAITLDDPTVAPDGVGTGLTHLFHSVIVPAPERVGENPYLSSASGGPADGSLHMTYEYLLLATSVLFPLPQDADSNPAHRVLHGWQPSATRHGDRTRDRSVRERARRTPPPGRDRRGRARPGFVRRVAGSGERAGGTTGHSRLRVGSDTRRERARVPIPSGAPTRRIRPSPRPGRDTFFFPAACRVRSRTPTIR